MGSGRSFLSRHLSKYLWTAMKDRSRKPAEATRRMKAGAGPVVRRWLGPPMIRCRTLRTTGGAGRRQVPGPGFVGGRGLGLGGHAQDNHLFILIGVSKISIRRTKTDISGHSPRFRVSVSDSGMTGWGYGREWFPGLGRSKCQPGAGLTAESAEDAEFPLI